MPLPSLLTPIRHLLTATGGVYAALTPVQKAAVGRLLRVGAGWLAADGLPVLVGEAGGAVIRALTGNELLATAAADALARGTLAGVRAALTPAASEERP